MLSLNPCPHFTSIVTAVVRASRGLSPFSWLQHSAAAATLPRRSRKATAL